MNFFFTKFSLKFGIEWPFRLPDRETNYFVRAGSNKLYQGGSLHKLTKIYMYNNTMFQYWFSSILYHDIALFEVRPRFRFSSTVRAVRLPTEFTKPPEQLCVCGWGYTSVQSNVSVCLVPSQSMYTSLDLLVDNLLAIIIVKTSFFEFLNPRKERSNFQIYLYSFFLEYLCISIFDFSSYLNF